MNENSHRMKVWLGLNRLVLLYNYIFQDCKYYTDGYKNGTFTPTQIANEIIKIIEEKNKQLNSITDYSFGFMFYGQKQNIQFLQKYNHTPYLFCAFF